MAQKASGGRTPEQVARDIKDYVQGKAGRKYRWRGYRSPQGSNVFDDVDPDTVPVGMTAEQLRDYRVRKDMYDADLIGDDYSQQKVNPYRVFRNRHTVRDMEAALDAFNKTDQFRDKYDTSFQDGQYDPRQYGEDNTGGTTDQAPAPITVVPTTTINPPRPRTVAAGWQATDENGAGTLTVIFRDGTYYNYYDVPEDVWNGFRASPSKGRYIRSSLDNFSRGRADMSGHASDARARAVMEALYAESRAAQTFAYQRGVFNKRSHNATRNSPRPSKAHSNPANGLSRGKFSRKKR